jgi:hypothetical protein
MIAHPSNVPIIPKPWGVVCLIASIIPGLGVFSAGIASKHGKSVLLGILEFFTAAFIVGWVYSWISGWFIFSKSEPKIEQLPVAATPATAEAGLAEPAGDLQSPAWQDAPPAEATPAAQQPVKSRVESAQIASPAPIAAGVGGQ